MARIASKFFLIIAVLLMYPADDLLACNTAHDMCHAKCTANDGGKCKACCNVTYAHCVIEMGAGDALPDGYLATNQHKCGLLNKFGDPTGPLANPDPCTRSLLSENKILKDTWGENRLDTPDTFSPSFMEGIDCLLTEANACHVTGIFDKKAAICCISRACSTLYSEVLGKVSKKCDDKPIGSRSNCLLLAHIKAETARKNCRNAYPPCIGGGLKGKIPNS